MRNLICGYSVIVLIVLKGIYQKKGNTVQRKIVLIVIPLLSIVLSLSGCQFTQSAFDKTVGNAGSAFAAASTTLRYFHQGKLLQTYTQASFEGYQSELDNVDQQLPSQSGAPDTKTVRQLLVVYNPAIHAIDNPCLTTHCDWQTQVRHLDDASNAFIKAGNG